MSAPEALIKSTSSLRQERCSLLDLTEEGPFDYINSVGVSASPRSAGGGPARVELVALAPNGPASPVSYMPMLDAGKFTGPRRPSRCFSRLVRKTRRPCASVEISLDTLPEQPIGSRRHHRDSAGRWIVLRMPTFADMYLHPQETSYNLEKAVSASCGDGRPAFRWIFES